MNEQTNFKVRFWGVRGSYPTPGPSTIRYGGNTPCVEVTVNGFTLIFDAGTGIIPLGRALTARARSLGKPVQALIFLSHLHHDHTQGFPFFAPAFSPTAQLHIFGPDFLGSTPQSTLEEVMNPPYFPIRLAEMNAKMNFSVLRETEVLRLDRRTGNINQCGAGEALPDDPNCVTVRVLRSYAHPQGVLHYRVDYGGQSLVYATDTEGYVSGDRRLARFAHNASLLIHDAQYTDEHYLGTLPGISITQGFGHSTVSMACQAALAASAERLVLFHHAPEYSDDLLDQVAQQATAWFPNVLLAAEGLELSLDSPNWPLPAHSPVTQANVRVQ
jgi:phosphoribosyl 1,2-cyclic phosphodiesterase